MRFGAGTIAAFILFGVTQTYGNINRWNGDTLPTEMLGRYYLTAGVDWIDVTGLNDTLGTLNSTEFSPYGIGVGFGWDMVYDWVITGGQVSGLFWDIAESDNRRTILWGGRALFNSGLQLTSGSQSNVLFYPLVGVGAGMTCLSIGPARVPFRQALATPERRLHVTQFSFLLHGALGLDYMMPTWRGFTNTVIGVRGGYIYDPLKGDNWYRSGTTITGGPDIQMTGPYIHIILGKGFRWSSKRMKRLYGK